MDIKIFLKAPIYKSFTDKKILAKNLLSLSRISSLGKFQFICSFNKHLSNALNTKCSTVKKAHQDLILSKVTFCWGNPDSLNVF